MKKIKYLVSFFLLIPVLSFSQTRVEVIRIIGGVPVDMVTAGGKTQILPDVMNAGDPVVLAIGLVDNAGNPVALNHDVEVSVVNSDVIPFLAEDDPDNIGAKRTFQYPKTISLVGGVGTFQLYPYRATNQDDDIVPDITEYQFVVKDKTVDDVVSCTSFPLDSVMPLTFSKLLLVLPGETHYPGKVSNYIPGEPPREGIAWDLTADKSYTFKVYGIDSYGNAVMGTTDLVWLERHQGLIAPQSPLPTDQRFLNELAKGVPIAKRTFEVIYAGTGRASLKVNSGTLTPGYFSYGVREFNVLPGTSQDNPIMVIPNPIGNALDSSPCAEITIRKVPLGGGEIRAKIFNQFGALVREFENNDIDGLFDASKPVWIINWCGKNDKGHRVANGVYHFCVEIVQVEKAGIWRTKIGVAW